MTDKEWRAWYDALGVAVKSSKNWAEWDFFLEWHREINYKLSTGVR